MDLVYSTPKELGFDPNGIGAVRNLVKAGLEKGLYPGAVFLICRHGKILEPECFGTLAPDSNQLVKPDTIYDLASLTKPIATATSTLILLQEGQLSLDQPISSFYPDYTNSHLTKTTIRHLLTHTSGLSEWKALHVAANEPQDVINGIRQLPPENPPGEVYNYSCLGYILLGDIVSKVSGQALDAFCRDHIFLPLGMNDTAFNPPKDVFGRIAPTSNCPSRRRVLLGEVHDANAWAMEGVSRNAGLFSTVMDLARFCSMMLSGGSTLLSTSTLNLCFQSLIDPAIGSQSAGWFVFPNAMLPCKNWISKQAIGHTGFTGTSVVIDVAFDIFVILLTNRVYFTDEGADFRHLRRRMNDLVSQAMISC